MISMSYSNVLTDVRQGKLKSVYLIYGEESYLARRLEQAIVDALLAPADRDSNLHIANSDIGSAELLNLIETAPFFGDKNVIIVRNPTWFSSSKKESDERLLDIVASFPAYCTLIIVTNDKVDKRKKLYKAFGQYGVTVEAAALKAKDIRLWLPEKLKELGSRMDTDGTEFFFSIVSMMSPPISLGLLDSELEKASLYAGGHVISKAHLQAVLATIPEVSVFAMIDAISSKQKHQAVQLLTEQLATGEHPLKIMALLNRQVRLLWQARLLAADGYASRQIAERLGVLPFIAEKLIRQSRGFSELVLKQALLALAEADWQLKSGRANNIVLEKIVIDMCR